MRVIYESPKGNRIKKGKIKYIVTESIVKIDNFVGLTHCVNLNEELLLWNTKLNKWVYNDSKEYSDNVMHNRYYNTNINNIKKAIRHLKKQQYIHMGTKFRLESNFKGFDIYIIV